MSSTTSYKNYLLPIIRVLGVFAFVLAIVLTVVKPTQVNAAPGLPPIVRIDTINGQAPSTIVCPTNPLSSPVIVRGSGQGSTPPGRVEQYGVSINWGDGSPVERTTAVFTPPTGSGVNFTFTFQSPAHNYVNGSYTITISLFHSNSSGNDNTIDATTSLQVCTFNPVTPALQITTLNGVSPSSFSCPDNPAPSPITIGGSGAGSAPPGNVADYAVVVDWGDGSAVEDAVSTFTPSSGVGVNFTYTFQTPSHTYALSGSYTATISLVRATASGDVVVVSNTVGVCAFTPVPAEIQIGLVNGQDPDTLTCPADAFDSTVSVSGSGQGSAPPGNVQDYSVVIDWGDGSAAEASPATFTPATGTLVNFTYTFASLTHTYTDDGNFTITASLVQATASGGAQVAATTTQDICVVLPTGIVTGEVSDSLTGFPIYGATVEDITDTTSVLGSFPGGSVYVIKPTPGLRTIRIRAKAWQDGIAQVAVVQDQVTVQNFVLTHIVTNQNIVGAALPIGNEGKKIFLVPEVVEAVVNGEIVDTTSVHAGHLFFFVGLPDGPTTFRGKNAFYNVTNTTTNLSGSIGTRTERGYTLVKMPTNVPEAPGGARVPVITGGITGVTSNGTTPVATTVYATFDFEGTPVTVYNETTGNGVYAIDLVPPGTAQVYADAGTSSARSPLTPVNVVGGTFTAQNLVVVPPDPVSQNFVPIIMAPFLIGATEDSSIGLTITTFTVQDDDNAFPASHTLKAYPGFNYTLANVTSTSVQVIPVPNFNDVLTVPVTVKDGISTSAPFNVAVSVGAVPDPTVYVNFDTGTTAASGARGTAVSPFRTIKDALAVVSPTGEILISGLTATRENLFTINQFVTLRNNNPGGQPVIINPTVQGGILPLNTTKTGFVSGSATSK